MLIFDQIWAAKNFLYRTYKENAKKLQGFEHIMVNLLNWAKNAYGTAVAQHQRVFGARLQFS